MFRTTSKGVRGVRAGMALTTRYISRTIRASVGETTKLRRNAINSNAVRAIANFPSKQGLYDPKLEKDSCGVGMVANLKKIPSRSIVDDANEMLVRMTHRGACGCEANTGDGAGMLVGMPDGFFRHILKEEQNIELPPLQQYGVGTLFISKDATKAAEAKLVYERYTKATGAQIIGWRDTPTNNDGLGNSALATEPAIVQVFVKNARGLSARDFERELLRVARQCSADAEAELGNEDSIFSDFYVCSNSCQTVTYKGQLTPEQLGSYFVDMSHPKFETHMALVHSRFSTNTFPSWDRAQPLRMMCHNGEINTLRGNKNWMASRGGNIYSSYFKDETSQLLPVCSDNMSDSGNFDSVLETVAKASDRSLPEAVMMMIPEAWQDNHLLSDEKKAFYEYNSCLMEPWDGPAMVAFTDGRYIGANLDRNGLRPSRYYITDDDRVLLSSEIGVLPHIPDEKIRVKSRLEPGKMFLVDFDSGKLVSDAEIKDSMAKARPYKDWLQKHLLSVDDLVALKKKASPAAESAASSVSAGSGTGRYINFDDTTRRLNMFGYTTETLDMILLPMAIGGKEALGSMGNDAALAVLSTQPRNMSDYFKQLFAQVTNPPIDPIRESLVMSLVCPVGPEENLLDVTEDHCKRMVVSNPILSLDEMDALKALQYDMNVEGAGSWKTKVIDATFPVGSGPEGLVDALADISQEASIAVQGEGYGVTGAKMIILSDRMAGPDRLPIPTLLAVGAVHQHLLSTKQRSRCAVFAESGDVREVHDFATSIGFGADGICPYTAYESIAKMNHDGLVEAKAKRSFDTDALYESYRTAAAKGILKVMSKMGISTLQSYKGAQVFEAVGLADEVIERCFTGTTSRLSGADFSALYKDIERMHDLGYPPNGNPEVAPLMHNPGQFHYRNNGEEHLNTPASMVALQLAARTNSRDAYKMYTELMTKQIARCTLRGLLKPKVLPESQRVSIDEVEPAKDIVKRFATGAMSLGSISRETHETLAKAMNHLGGKSNTGEGGEDPVRFTDNRRSSIKQVASGRFGVTSHYIANSDQIQIKMAQGAKPGEGGELPGFKVSKYIADNRHTTPGVGLISPPPHHDIYSIEDLAQLIFDLKHANPTGDVSVKLVSEVGVGVVAAGVSKAKADHIVISGGDGGTGAAVWTGIKGAGLPWELGIAEAQQTLVLNDLRSRIVLQTDGQLKTGRDVLIGALLGAEEFGFSTAPLIVLGCIMMRKCHLNTCPVGVATQDPELRRKFTGHPEHVVNFFFMLAEEVRGYMANMGIKKFDDLIGRVDLLEVNKEVLHYKSEGLDLQPLLTPASDLNPGAGTRNMMRQDHGLDTVIDRRLIEQSKPALEKGEKVEFTVGIENIDRSMGGMLSNQVSKIYGAKGLPEDTIRITAEGHGGQSLGFTLAPGVTIEVLGDSNDYVGKGLSGGKVIVKPKQTVLDQGFKTEDNVIVGNTCLYGATKGKAFFRGVAGERFAVRNSGAVAVVEAVGDHGCEYMTGGRVVVLGKTGRNFAAGMSGGIAFVYNPQGEFETLCNMGMVGLSNMDAGSDDDAELKGYISEFVSATGSEVGQRMLDNWGTELPKFVKILPHDYKRVMDEEAEARRLGLDPNAGREDEESFAQD